MIALFHPFTLRKQLAEPAIKMLDSRRVSGRASPQAWLAILDDLGAFDRCCERARRHAGLGALFSGIAVIGCLLVAFYPGAIGSGILFIPFFGLWLRFRAIDLPDALRLFVSPLVAVLREDMKSGALLSIDADLSGPLVKEKKTNVQKIPRAQLHGRVRSRKETFYEDPWLEIRGKFVDQTSFILTCRDEVIQADITKRSQSGKTKSKRKYKFKRLTGVVLKPDPTQYAPVNPDAAPANTAAQIKQRENGFTVHASQKEKKAGKPESSVPDIDDLLLLVGYAVSHCAPLESNPGEPS